MVVHEEDITPGRDRTAHVAGIVTFRQLCRVGCVNACKFIGRGSRAFGRDHVRNHLGRGDVEQVCVRGRDFHDQAFRRPHRGGVILRSVAAEHELITRYAMAAGVIPPKGGVLHGGKATRTITNLPHLVLRIGRRSR